MRVIKKDIDIFIDQLQKGDEGAFRVLFDEFYTALCLFAERFLGEREAAADVVQEAFLKYWDRHMDFDNYYKIKSFLYVVVRHDCLNLLRNKREDLPVTEDIAMDSDEFFHNQVMEEEAYRVFYRAIEHLPPQMRNVINYALEGLKNADIAQKMGVSENAVHAYKKEAYQEIEREYERLLLPVGYIFLISVSLINKC